jgi:hypothetical protein
MNNVCERVALLAALPLPKKVEQVLPMDLEETGWSEAGC